MIDFQLFVDFTGQQNVGIRVGILKQYGRYSSSPSGRVSAQR
jgi:hypothetical protein